MRGQAITTEVPWPRGPEPRRAIRIARTAAILALAVFLIFGVLFGVPFMLGNGCAPGPPGLNPSKLSAAILTVAYPSDRAPRKISIDIADTTKRDALVEAYRSMKKWRMEISSYDPTPDYSLEMQLKDGRRFVVVLAFSGWPYGLIRKYKGDRLEQTAYVDLGEMKAYLVSVSTK